MKKLIFRKFLLDAFFSFLVLIVSFSVIVWVIQAVNYLDFISEDGHGFKVYFLYTL
jgi:lipopolysaccharide export system permease protein